MLPIRGMAETYLSVFGGPSLSLMQDIKSRTFDENGARTNVKMLGTETSLRFKEGLKLTHFFPSNFGIEGEFFHGQVVSSIDTTGDGNVDTSFKQERYSFMLFLVFRQKVNHAKVASVYGGMGTGGIYSDFGNVAKDWGYAGQFFSGMNFDVRGNLFIEAKYIWAPDVGGDNTSPGTHLKVSGNPKNNLATHLFGPHHDTQILSLVIGTRFKVGD